MSFFERIGRLFSSSTPTPGAFALSPSISGLGEGSIRWRVDCSANPLDPRPAAQVILAAIDQMQARLAPDQPLVVLMGETHSMPTHLALQSLVIEDLHTRGDPFTVAYESPYNIWARVAHEGMEKTVPEALFYRPGPDINPLGLASLATFAGHCVPFMAPLSDLARMAALYDLIAGDAQNGKTPRVKFCFNDAAKDDNILDLRDPQTRRAFDAVRADGRWRLPMWWTERLGYLGCNHPFRMVVRNEVMKTIALDFARGSGNHLIVQITGRNHCLGNREEGYRYPDSLDAHFRRAGAAVLTVFPTSSESGIETVPTEAAQASALIVDGLGEDQFYSFHGLADPEELCFMNNIVKATQGRVPSIDVLASRAAWQETARRHVDGILAAHAAGKEPYDPVPCL